MSLSEPEKLVLEALSSMLGTKHDHLGIPDASDESIAERGMEYHHNEITDSYALEIADSAFHDGTVAAFNKVHSFRYLDDPKFKDSLMKELTAQGVPKEQREKALDAVDKVIKKMGGDTWAEKDHGFNPNLDDVVKSSLPENL